MSNLGPFWRRVFVKAFADTLAALHLQSGGAGVITVLIAAIYVVLVWHYVGKDEFESFLTQEMMGWLAPLAVFSGALLFRMLAVPAEFDAEAQIGLAKLKPKLRLSFTKNQGTAPIETGTVRQTGDGRQYVTCLAEDVILRVTCTNESAHRIDDCQAWLVGAMHVEDDGTLEAIGFDEPVHLLWSHGIASGDFYLSLQPKIARSIYVLLRRPHPALLIYRQAHELRLDYPTLFHRPGKHRIWVQVNGPSDAADRICLDVWPVDPLQVPNQLPRYDIGVEIVSTGFSPEPLGVMNLDILGPYRS